MRSAIARWRWVTLFALLGLLGGCGRADQAIQQPSSAPLSPLPAATDAAPAAPTVRPTLNIFRPTPDEAQRAVTATAAFLLTSVAAWRNEVDATATAEMAWALTPEPTILPPKDGTRLRDLWPASPQQTNGPNRLYLRSQGGDSNADTFWEVRLPDARLRRLPVIEEESLDNSARVSPDGRFLAYVTGDSPHTLRLLDLATDTDLGIALHVTRSWPNCHQHLAWSPDGRTLAVLAVVPTDTDWRYQIVLLEPHTRSTPLVLLDVPAFSYLHGWLDSEHLLISRLQSLDGISLLLSLNRQGRTAPISEIPLGDQVCTTLSPAGTTLIFNQPGQVTRVQLPSGQQDALDITPDILLNSQHGLWRATPPELFWLEGGNRLLFSCLGTERRVWFISLDQPQQRPRNEDGLFLSPPYQPSVRLGVIGVSPDERTLAVCEQPHLVEQSCLWEQFVDLHAGRHNQRLQMRRPAGASADWRSLASDNYPYQERVLNNLPLPRTLNQHPDENISEWLAEGLGAKQYTSQADSGLFPEDSIFVRRNPDSGALESYAPNLLLFRHRTLPLVPDVNVQTIAFEYDLPFSAQVTITLALADQTELPLCTQAGKAGWNQLYCRANVRLQNGDAYRIRAERGNPEQPAGYYLGQYLQRFDFTDLPLQTQNLPYAVHIPLVQNIGRPVALFNRSFSQSDPRAGWKPDYWDVQALASRNQGTGLPSMSSFVGRSQCRRAGGSEPCRVAWWTCASASRSNQAGTCCGCSLMLSDRMPLRR